MITPLPLPKPPRRLLSRLPAPGRLIPDRLHSPGLTLILNRLLAAPLADGELDFLRDKVLRIEVMDLALDHRLTLGGGRLVSAPATAAEDVRFGGNAREFLLLALNEEDPDTLFFQRRLQLEGDTELGLEIKNLLYSLDEDLLPAPLRRLARRLVGLLD